MKEAPVHRLPLHVTHGAGIRVGEDGLWSCGRFCDRRQALGDFIERVIPRNHVKLTAPLGARPPHWTQQALRVICPLDVAIDLGAEETLREWVLAVTGDASRAPILDCYKSRTRIRAIVWTRAAYDVSFNFWRSDSGHKARNVTL